MKILAFAGSNSKNSINKALVTHVSTYFKGCDIRYLDINEFKLPIYGIDEEKAHGIPNAAYDFINTLKRCDLILLSLAEHNGAYTAAFKNLLDWCSRIPNETVFQNKPMFLMATSPGGRGAKSVLEIGANRFPRNGARVLAALSLPKFKENFELGRGIIDSDLREEFEATAKEVYRQVKED
ncbi:NAD(P)H-dependent FMN reductase [Lishizhenia tianjinensis]|uniref:NAD(P)H-dependent FMN reductase n=1 Tax=Lishizhenia tianjinensis TaxID=477690 RepID=A0A1I7APR0_9FLAO|nr:NAD(P)H-dependent oxidoreductase [Lishizhenia tianjinensis]SFT76885.1 NAD(P)H-dependent FMN reductase [Lishizhenia tianjinensis]